MLFHKHSSSVLFIQNVRRVTFAVNKTLRNGATNTFLMVSMQILCQHI